MELKEQLKQELLNQKEEKIKKQIEENSKLKTITVYAPGPKHPNTEIYFKHLDSQGIKYKFKDILKHKKVGNTVRTNQFPVISVNNNYLLLGRDFKNQFQLASMLKYFADPNWETPSHEELVIEQLKTLNNTLGTQFANLNRQLQPVIKIMNELAKEEEILDEKKDN